MLVQTLLQTYKMGYKCISAAWIFLTILLSGAITIAVLSPVWFKNEKEINNIDIDDISKRTKVLTFGLLRSCTKEQLSDVLFKCDFYDIFNDRHSIAWIICGSLFCIGLLLFLVCVLLLVCGLCLTRSKNIKYRGGLSYIQGVGVGFLIIAVFLYPLGLNSEYARSVCGNSNLYYAGECKVAWGYVLIIMSVLLTIFCPILGKFSITSKDEYSVALYDSESDMFSTSSTAKVMTTV